MSEPYQVMPPLGESEYEALKASIAAGYDPAHPIVTDEAGVVLDGHHRQRVCRELGITPPTVILPGLTEDQKHDYAMRANLACRHLTQLQKRELIRAELDRDPSRSNREIGRLVGADHKTVAAVRRSGEIPHQRESAQVALARNAARMVELDDELIAEQAEVEEYAERWRQLWASTLATLKACTENWNSVLARHTGYGTCWEWVQAEHADQWRILTANVGLLQGLDPLRTHFYRIAPIAPTVAEAEQILQGAS